MRTFSRHSPEASALPETGNCGMKTVLAVYSITMGVALIVMWSFFWANGLVPEMLTRPWEIAMHLTAEFTTSGLLIISGIGMLKDALWARRVNLFATGMLVYSLIQSPGYYLQRNALIFVVMFAVSFLITVMLSPVFKPAPQKMLVQARPPEDRIRDRA
jgi:hypothetical protein